MLTIYVEVAESLFVSLVDLRINETLQTGAVGNRTYQIQGVKVSICFYDSPMIGVSASERTPFNQL